MYSGCSALRGSLESPADLTVKLLVHQSFYLSPAIIARGLEDRSFPVQSCEEVAALDGDEEFFAHEVLCDPGVKFGLEFLESDVRFRGDGEPARAFCDRADFGATGLRNAVYLVPDFEHRDFAGVDLAQDLTHNAAVHIRLSNANKTI